MTIETENEGSLAGAAGSALFRAALAKTLPGYSWTVHKPIGGDLRATGIQSSGSNRCSTIEAVMKSGGKWFEARISGYGTRAPWLQLGCGSTLPQAIRSLQNGLEHQAQILAAQARTVQAARTLPNGRDEPRGANAKNL